MPKRLGPALRALPLGLLFFAGVSSAEQYDAATAKSTNGAVQSAISNTVF